MTVSFTCKTNNKTPYINYAVYKYNGKKVLVDRDMTEWTYDKKTKVMEMDWSGVYIWDDKNSDRVRVPDGFFETAEFKKFDVEDDAPKGYRVKLVEEE